MSNLNTDLIPPHILNSIIISLVGLVILSMYILHLNDNKALDKRSMWLYVVVVFWVVVVDLAFIIKYVWR